MADQPFDESAARQLAAATLSARVDVARYGASYDDVRIGRMLAREPVFADTAQRALAEIQRLRDLVDRASTMLEAKSDRPARLEWARQLRSERGGGS